MKSDLAVASAVAAGARAITEADFADLVRENQAMVYSIAYNFLHDGALAEELAQDVFLQLYRSLGKMESRSHVTHWLRRVTGHRSIDFSRKQGFGRESRLDSSPEPAVHDTPADPLLRDRMRKLVASLPPRQRLLVVLRYQEEMEFEEIGKIVRMPARTARTQLFRTLALLREKAARLLQPRDCHGAVGTEVS